MRRIKQKISRKIKVEILRLLKSNSGPNEIALGIALGVIIGFLPFYGLHTVIVLGIAMLIPHTNRIAMLIGMNVTIPPTAPFVYWASYSVGRFLLGNKAPALNIESIKSLTMSDIPGLFYTLFYGCIVLGMVCAVAAYFATYYFVAGIKKKQKEKVVQK
jgi:uncharacterized protein (TIGR03546 family)